MITSGNVPEHLVVGARTGFLAAANNSAAPWRSIAGTIAMTAGSLTLVDLGGAPMPTESIGGSVIQSFVEKHLDVKPRNWEVTVGVSYNAVQDDQTGNLENKVRGAAENFDRHMNKLVFSALDAGDAATYGLCYDGLNFFSATHVDKGGAYQTSQDNNKALALSLDNFTTNLNVARLFMDDQGVYTEHNYDTLIVPPALEFTAAQICGNAASYDTANREANPYSGKFNFITSPYMNTTAWVIAASKQAQKPLYLVQREAPALQSAWFDPKGPDGGTFMFKFYARYNTVYGDWRLAILGNS